MFSTSTGSLWTSKSLDISLPYISIYNSIHMKDLCARNVLCPNRLYLRCPESLHTTMAYGGELANRRSPGHIFGWHSCNTRRKTWRISISNNLPITLIWWCGNSCIAWTWLKRTWLKRTFGVICLPRFICLVCDVHPRILVSNNLPIPALRSFAKEFVRIDVCRA